ncbi:TRFR-like protein [Mya arenaria]|uniref:TRFR-like protein n=1 Tax=Mya arenaria TaxID=6604 RepID=A0ABY7FKR0_MYAAR|nr:TRFR-like protein [Mya arenaria]
MAINSLDINLTYLAVDEKNKYELHLDNTTTGIEIENNVVPFIPLYIYICVPIVNVIIFLVGFVGNILVIMVVIKVRDMRTPTNVFLLNLSLADVLVLVVCQPAALLEFFGKDRWFLGELMCRPVGTPAGKWITLERYNALCQPFKRRVCYTIGMTIKSLVIIWVTAFCLTIPFVIITVHDEAKFYDGSDIHVCRTKINGTWKYCYIVFIFVMFFVVPFIFIIVVYYNIIRQLLSDTLKILAQNDRSAMHTIQARKQVVYMLIFIIILFFVTLFPIRVVTLWLIFSPPSSVNQIGLEGFLNLIAWARVLMYINSAGNPVIYSLTSSKFKTAFKRLFRTQNGNKQGSINNTTARYTLQNRHSDKDGKEGHVYIALKKKSSNRAMLTEFR